jgi:hypothetical protein
VVDLDLSPASGLLASRYRTSPMLRAWYTSSMALGTRYPYDRRSDSGAPMNESQVRASGQGGAQTLKALHLEALLVRRFCDPLEGLLAVDGELP